MFWWAKWFPWRWLIATIARRQGFLDPLPVMAKLQQFSQPSEIREPIELLRAGVIFHARGLINSRVIQHNLDWVWPYWIERQFNPNDVSFIPRAFSLTHVNLTHRNWTAIGIPGVDELSIVDPRGLLTPHYDGWSIDAWLINENGESLIPSRTKTCTQRSIINDGLSIETYCSHNGLSLHTIIHMELQSGIPTCILEVEGESDAIDAWLVISVRPQNPEGVSFIHEVTLDPKKKIWTIDGNQNVYFDRFVEKHVTSDYHMGDVSTQLFKSNSNLKAVCNIGMASAASLFKASKDKKECVTVSIPINRKINQSVKPLLWNDALMNSCSLRCPDQHYQYLYDTAIRTLILHSPLEIYPGPYTYKRFWFRDAAYIINGLLLAGLTNNARNALDQFPVKQNVLGYFHSQEGEWDSNGQALWIMNRYCQITGESPPLNWLTAIKKGAQWICNKKLDDLTDVPHAGLLPAGFSAEHLGPNDYYYWDDFWSIAGLRSAFDMLKAKDPSLAKHFYNESNVLEIAVKKSLDLCAKRLGKEAIPASPYRRLDAGAIGSMVASYPLCLTKPEDKYMQNTVNFLLDYCFIDDAFFQDIIHSGLNAYLTLHVAQVLLRAGDSRYAQLMESVAKLASPTGQWPEAIHPRTLGGCMGDGQHVWAAAEWVILLRNCLLREEGEELIIGSGISNYWLSTGGIISFGPAPTQFGIICINIHATQSDKITISWNGQWHQSPPPIIIDIPGYQKINVTNVDRPVTVKKAT